MYCPGCGVENAGETSRFCRSCGADLRAISQAMGGSLPVKLANTLDAYLENRFQRNFGNGVLNILAFVAVVIVGSGYLVSGWTGSGLFMVGLGALSLLVGFWDIWIYRRNLPPVAKQSTISSTPSNELEAPRSDLSPTSVAEPTTKKLEISNK